MKNSLEGFKGRFEQAEESELEDRTMEIINSEKPKERSSKKSEQSLWVIIKWTNLWIKGVLEGAKGERDRENIF